MNLLYINNRWIKSFDEVVEVFNRPEAKNSDEPLYDRLIDLAVDQELADFLEALGKSKLSEQIRNIEIDGDPIIMEALQKMITGKKVEIPKDTNSRIRFISATIDTDSIPAKAVFKVQILKVKQEIVKFSVLSKKQRRKDKVIHLNEYKKNDEIEIQIDLNEPSDEICFAIDGKEVCRCMPDYLMAFHCNVSDANLTIDGTQIEGTFPIEERLRVGNHTIKVSKVGYDDYKEQIVVSRKSVHEIELTEQPFGKDLVFKVGDVPFVMKAVKGGTFNMGAQKNDIARPNYDYDAYDEEGPVHSVIVDSFYMGQTPVTEALWKAVMKDDVRYDRYYWHGDNTPVIVNWSDCQAFIKKMNEITGKKFRMPTETEWEYADRGGVKSNGYKYAGSNAIEEVAWYGDSNGWPKPVKCKKPNELSIFDMSGNVWEWCVSNRTTSVYGEQHILRGGSCRHGARRCRVSYRYDTHYQYINEGYTGFRLVLEQ